MFYYWYTDSLLTYTHISLCFYENKSITPRSDEDQQVMLIIYLYVYSWTTCNLQSMQFFCFVPIIPNIFRESFKFSDRSIYYCIPWLPLKTTYHKVLHIFTVIIYLIIATLICGLNTFFEQWIYILKRQCWINFQLWKKGSSYTLKYLFVLTTYLFTCKDIISSSRFIFQFIKISRITEMLF